MFYMLTAMPYCGATAWSSWYVLSNIFGFRKMNPISAQQILRVALLVLVSCAPVALMEKPEPETSQVTRQLDWIFDDTRAYEGVEYFTQFCRIAGGPGFDSCLKYIESNLGLGHPLTYCGF